MQGTARRDQGMAVFARRVADVSGCSLDQAGRVARLYLRERIAVRNGRSIRLNDASFMQPRAILKAIAIVEGQVA